MPNAAASAAPAQNPESPGGQFVQHLHPHKLAGVRVAHTPCLGARWRCCTRFQASLEGQPVCLATFQPKAANLILGPRSHASPVGALNQQPQAAFHSLAQPSPVADHVLSYLDAYHSPCPPYIPTASPTRFCWGPRLGEFGSMFPWAQTTASYPLFLSASPTLTHKPICTPTHPTGSTAGHCGH